MNVWIPVKRVRGSKYLHLDFRYYGERCRQSSGFPDTPSGREEAETALNQIMNEIQQGNFNFAKTFPFASDEKKHFFSQLEGRDYSPSERDVTFGEYFPQWKERLWHTFSVSKQTDFESRLNHHILPFFKHRTFQQIKRITVKQFLGLLTSVNNRNGRPLTRGTIENILTPLKEIYYDAVDQYEWDLPDPFTRLGKCMPEGNTEDVQVFTFAEWMKTLDELFWVYGPGAEFSVMTGVRPSELAGLRKEIDFKETFIQIQNSIVRKREKDELKTSSSKRTIPITPKMREVIEKQIEIKEKMGKNSPHLFINSEGKPFDIEVFRENAWKSAEI